MTPARTSTSTPTPTSLVLELMRAQRRHLVGLAAWSVPQALPALVAGAAVARAVDDGFLAGRSAVGLAWLAVFAASAVVGAFATGRAFIRLGAVVEPVRDELVRRAVAGSLRRSARYGAPADTGAIARLTEHSEVARDTLAGLVLMAVEFPVTIVAALIGMATLAPVVLWFVVPPLVVTLVVLVATSRRLAERQRQVLLANERLAEDATRYVTGLRDVTACGGEAASTARLDDDVAAHVAAAEGIARLAAARAAALGLGVWLPVVLVVVATPWLVRRGMTPGEVVGAFTYLLHGLHTALSALAGGLTGSGARLAAILRRVTETSEEPGDAGRAPDPGDTGDGGNTGDAGYALDAGNTGRGAGGGRPNRPVAVRPAGVDLELRRVTFAYSARGEPVLRDLDLAVPAGDHLAVVGPSGIGKSTLAALGAGMLRPGRGEVCVGGTPAHEAAAGARVLIPQQAYVFAGTLGENLRYLCPAAPAADLDRAADAVGLGPLVDRVGGYDAPVAPATLSAGEQQLVALGRAYLSPARLVILDEATCHLDPTTEADAERAFLERGGTLVVIAHRVSSALRARRVLVLDGAEAALGTPDALVHSSPLYRDLVGYWNGDEPSRSDGAHAGARPG
jgi:ATP-binding cassette subfamily C protein